VILINKQTEAKTKRLAKPRAVATLKQWGHQAWAGSTSGQRRRCPLPRSVRHKLPRRGPGRSPDRKRIFAYFWVTEF